MAISIPHSFTDGNVAEAAEVNANFGAVASFVNNLQDGSGLDSGAIVTAKLADSAVISSKIAPDAVTTAKILDGSVTTAKIPDSGITAAKLAADSVTTAKIANSAVTLAKLSSDAIPGLSLISSTTIGSAVSSVTISNAFSSTYDNYRVFISGGVGSGSLGIGIQLGAGSPTHHSISFYLLYSNSNSNNLNAMNASYIPRVASASTNSLNGVIDIISPNLPKNTYVSSDGNFSDQGGAGFSHGYVADNNQYTSFTLVCMAGNITGGTVKVYGYKN